MSRSGRRLIIVGVLSVGLAALVIPRVIGASKSVDLDSRTANAAESAVALDILSTFPPKIQDKVTNRAVSNSYTFNYASAGPGGFSSQLGAGTTAGVGAQWIWQTSQTIYSFTGTSCANDICFTKVAGPDPAPSNAVAWRVPGRTLVPNGVTVSSASLTSSLVTFFSPPNVLVEVTSSVFPLASGQLGYHTTWTNNTTQSVVVDLSAAPLGCCPDPGRLNCDGKCIDYLTDVDNCGGCGNSCEEICGNSSAFECGGSYCDYGYCVCDGGYERFRLGVSTPDATRYPGGDAVGRARLGQKVTRVRPNLEEGGIEEAPVCSRLALTRTIEPGATFDPCVVSSFLPKEVSSVLTVCGTEIPDGETSCGNGDPASSGTFMQFVPDDTKPYPYPGVLITPFQVTVIDPNGDGVLQPGETALVYVSVFNVGTESLLNPVGTLSSPPVDLTDDGVDDPSSIDISVATSNYSPDLLAVPSPEPGDCDGPPLDRPPSVNVVAFEVTIPPDHPGDVARPFTLEFTSQSLTQGFGPTTLTLPVTVGIGSSDADLGVTLTDSTDPALAGTDFSYQMKVTNAGPLAAVDVEVKNTLPAGAALVSFTTPLGWSCSSSGASGTDVVTCTAATLTPGACADFSILVHAAACTGPLALTDGATVSAATPDENQANNSASESTEVLDGAPGVQITQPVSDQLGSPPVTLPITIHFVAQPVASPVVHETVSLESCVLWDGLTYGDRDGLLSDEPLQTNKYILCQAMARCGLFTLNYPRIVVNSTDACNRTSQDDVIIRRRLLKTEVCAP